MNLNNELSNRPGRTGYLICVFIILVFSGCAHYPINAPVKHLQPGLKYSNNIESDRSDELFIALTFSGGGTRAAALSYGVLEKLKNTKVNIGGRSRRLLDEVDMISSVSGGSFTAAYFGLFGDRIFEDFETRFLNQNVQGKLTRNLFSPTSWVALATSKFDRSDMAAEYYDEILFKGKTFGDLESSNSPSILINSTDAIMGSRFSFNKITFDFICSDLSQFPVSRAVAASSAVPIIFSSVTIRNYAGTCGYEPPKWIRDALNERDTLSRRYQLSLTAKDYLNREDRPFIHLYDGGLSDNLGVRPLLDRVDVAGDAWQAIKSAGLERTRKLVIIVVNAQTEPDTSPNKVDESVSLTDTVNTVSSVPLARYSFETLDLLRKNLDIWEKDIPQKRCEHARKNAAQQSSLKLDETSCGDFRYHLIEVNFGKLPNEEESLYLKSLPTSFSLDTKDVDHLREVAARILTNSKEFNTLLIDLK